MRIVINEREHNYHPADKWFKGNDGWVRVERYLSLHGWEKWVITAYPEEAVENRFGKNQPAGAWAYWKETYEEDMAHKYFEEAMRSMGGVYSGGAYSTGKGEMRWAGTTA